MSKHNYDHKGGNGNTRTADSHLKMGGNNKIT